METMQYPTSFPGFSLSSKRENPGTRLCKERSFLLGILSNYDDDDNNNVNKQLLV